MKHAKRMTAVLLALLLLAALAVPGMAAPSPETYTAVSFNLPSLGLTETLTAIYEDYKNPAVTYTLTLGEMKVFNSYDYYFYSDNYGIATGKQYAPSEATITAAKALNRQTLATATFAANEVPYEESSGTKMSKTVSYSPADGILAEINRLSFDRPCIVYWPVEKKITCASSDLTNFNHSRATDGTTQTVMILRVDDNGSGELSPTLSFAAPQEINPTTLMALLEEKYAASGDPTLSFEEWVEDQYGYDDLDAFFSEYTTNYVQFMDDFGPGSNEKPSPDINYANFPYIFTESNQKFQEFQDEYPATNSLKVEKLVTGNQGKKDQYFKFTVVLGGQSDDPLTDVLPEIASQLEYVTDNSVHTATPKYGERFVTYDDATPPVITSRYDNEHPTVRIKEATDTPLPGDLFYFDNDSEGGYHPDWISLKDWIEIDFWLKHGESFEIKNIPANVEFFAAFERPSAEGDMLNNTYADPDYYFDGYTVTTLYSRTETGGPGHIPQLDVTYVGHGGSITKGAVDLTWSGQQSFSPYTSDDKVTFTNSKDTSTPTGLSLQTAAPIAGAVIALGLGAVLLLSRRRRGSAQ